MPLLSDCPTLSDYITRAQVDGVLWKADRLLKSADSPILRNERVAEIALTIARMPAAHQVVKDDYIRKISADYNINRKTLEKLVADQTGIERKKSDLVRTVRKNQADKLDGDAKTFPFFTEVVNRKTNTVKITVDKLKYVQLLASFGFTRYSVDNDVKDGFAFVRLTENVISEVTKEEIIDHIEHFIQKEYNFEGAGCEQVDAPMLMNVFYDGLKTLFSKDLFARVRISTPIVINRDSEKECFLYYQNGFVRITADTYELLDYDKMNGSVWAKQMLPRKFTMRTGKVQANAEGDAADWDATFTTDRPLGDFADFVWRICGQKQQRYISLCSIVGYMMHDFYEYKLKAIVFTDSLVSEKNEGRTGKTLLMQMLGLVRSYCEINGKSLKQDKDEKYASADHSTQILHINDINHHGQHRFNLESMYNDITEGYTIRQLYKSAFRHRSKIAISTNKSLPVEGSSARDRVVEFEMSNFFNEHRSPKSYYGKWMGGKEWDDDEWVKFDNFLCFCAGVFLRHGLVPPETINLEARKLLDQTSREFLEFMHDIVEDIKVNKRPATNLEVKIPDDALFNQNPNPQLGDFEFDKGILFNRFLTSYPDFKANHFTQKRFTQWLQKYATLAMGIKEPMERRSNGIFYIQFKEKSQTT